MSITNKGETANNNWIRVIGVNHVDGSFAGYEISEASAQPTGQPNRWYFVPKDKLAETIHSMLVKDRDGTLT